MKIKLFSTLFFLSLFFIGNAQQDSPWKNWERIIGVWQGEGSGEPGQGGGEFSFAFKLDKNIIERKSHSEYPATDSQPKVIHDDLMFVYIDIQGIPSKSIYFDNEGHTINYSISYAENSIVMQSEKLPDTPVFRLTYSFLNDETVNTKFEMSQDGINFFTYIEGDSKKVKN